MLFIQRNFFSPDFRKSAEFLAQAFLRIKKLESYTLPAVPNLLQLFPEHRFISLMPKNWNIQISFPPLKTFPHSPLLRARVQLNGTPL